MVDVTKSQPPQDSKPDVVQEYLEELMEEMKKKSKCSGWLIRFVYYLVITTLNPLLVFASGFAYAFYICNPLTLVPEFGEVVKYVFTVQLYCLSFLIFATLIQTTLRAGLAHVFMKTFLYRLENEVAKKMILISESYSQNNLDSNDLLNEYATQFKNILGRMRKNQVSLDKSIFVNINQLKVLMQGKNRKLIKLFNHILLIGVAACCLVVQWTYPAIGFALLYLVFSFLNFEYSNIRKRRFANIENGYFIPDIEKYWGKRTEGLCDMVGAIFAFDVKSLKQNINKD